MPSAAASAAAAARAANKNDDDFKSAIRNSLKNTLGRESVDDTDVAEFLNKGSEESAFSEFDDCMSEDNAQIDVCKVRAKQAAAAAKGVDELDAADFEEKLRRGAESKAKDALKAAISAKKDDGTAYSKAEILAELKEKIKGVVGETDKANVDDSDGFLFIKNAADEDAVDTMSSCSEAKEDDSDLTFAKCLQKAKKDVLDMMKGVRGDDAVTEFDASAALERGCTKASASKMQACWETAETDDEKTACKAKAKKVIAQSLGKADNDVSETELRHRLNKGAADTAFNIINAQKKANSSITEEEVKEKIKESLKAALGKPNIDDADVEFFKRKVPSRMSRTSSARACRLSRPAK